MRLIDEEVELNIRIKAVYVIGHFAPRIPSLITKDLSLLQNLFDKISMVGFKN
jgi:hypothetical protein